MILCIDQYQRVQDRALIAMEAWLGAWSPLALPLELEKNDQKALHLGFLIIFYT